MTVLDAREGPWIARKRWWQRRGLQSELGRRTAGAYHRLSGAYPGVRDGHVGTTPVSIFDPVLCEVMYRWFCPPAGRILDPFAGGSVRGVVAGALGRHYTGIDLLAHQIKANRQQWRDVAPRLPGDWSTVPPQWITGDSVELDGHVTGPFDFIFTCPPYADLEVYSDDPRDLSTMDYPHFLAVYRTIIAKACALLREDRFAAIVVGEVRDSRGYCRGFVHDTVQAFRDAGLHYYNEAVLVTVTATTGLRASASFPRGRKLGRTHQSVLCFVRGDPLRAAASCEGVPTHRTLLDHADGG